MGFPWDSHGIPMAPLPSAASHWAPPDSRQYLWVQTWRPWEADFRGPGPFRPTGPRLVKSADFPGIEMGRVWFRNFQICLWWLVMCQSQICLELVEKTKATIGYNWIPESSRKSWADQWPTVASAIPLQNKDIGYVMSDMCHCITHKPKSLGNYNPPLPWANLLCEAVLIACRFRDPEEIETLFPSCVTLP